MSTPLAAAKADKQRLGGAEKAACVLLTLPKEKAIELIKRLDPAEMKVLAQAAESLQLADNDEVERVVAEFEADFIAGVRLPGNGSEVRGLIAEVLGQEQFDAVLSGAPPAEEPVWPQLADLKDEALHDYLMGQHPQVMAYMLSQLPSGRVASILKLLSREQRNDLIARMLSLGSVGDAMKAEVERAIRLDLRKTDTRPSRPYGSIAGILNEMEPTLTDEAIAYLEGSVPEDASAIRKLLFKFEDLPTLAPKSLTVLFDRIPVERIVVALQGADPALMETVLSSMAPRARRLAESELQSGATVAPGDIVSGRKAIVETVLTMLSAGELALANADAAAAEQQPA